ncbi:MAG TPA: hypothetical protein ENK57_00650 [Polyangiaceae bacterium]|nr:hypothetical protein [Polyangiaceae bacterium]
MSHEFRPPDDKLSCPAFSPAFYPEHAHRGNANVECLSLWVGDLDAVGDDEFEQFLARCRERGWAVAYFSTWSHARKPGVSARPVLPLSREVTPDEWHHVWNAVNDALGGLSDPKCKDPARLYFGAYAPDTPEARAAVRHEVIEGRPVDVDELLGGYTPRPTKTDNAPPTRDRKKAPTLVRERLRRYAKGHTLSKNPYRKELGHHLLLVAKGESFADAGSRDDWLFKMCADLAERFPEHDPESIARLFAPSLQLMAQEAPECPTVADALEKIERKQDEARELRRLAFKRGDEKEAADRLIAMLRDRSDGNLVFSEGDFYEFEATSGTWQAIERSELSRIVQGFAGTPVMTSATDVKSFRVGANTVRGVIALTRDALDEPDFFAEAPAGIVFAGKFVRVDADGIHGEPAAPAHRARWGHDFDLDLDAEPKRFLAFLRQTHGNDPDCDERVAFLCEFIGMALIGRAPDLQRALLLYGGGDDGKSATIAMIEGLFTDRDIASVPPGDWGNDQHRDALVGKRLNTVADLPVGKVPDDGKLKQIISGEPMTAKRVYEPPSEPTAGTPRSGFAARARAAPADLAGVTRCGGAVAAGATGALRRVLTTSHQTPPTSGENAGARRLGPCGRGTPLKSEHAASRRSGRAVVPRCFGIGSRDRTAFRALPKGRCPGARASRAEAAAARDEETRKAEILDALRRHRRDAALLEEARVLGLSLDGAEPTTKKAK